MAFFQLYFLQMQKLVALVASTKLKRGTTAYDVPLLKLW